MDEITKDEITADMVESESLTKALEGDTVSTASEIAAIPIKESVDAIDTTSDNDVDYAAMIEEDIATLKGEFPELASLGSITELDNPIRYAALRDLGLSAEEAYLATTKRVKRDNRAHLTAAYGKNAASPTSTMSQRELSEARELFGNLSDLEIQRLYKRVKERS